MSKELFFIKNTENLPIGEDRGAVVLILYA